VATYVPVIGIAYLAYTYFIHVCVDVSGKAVVVCEYPARWPWLVWWFGEQFAGLPIRMAKPGTCALTAARREVFSNVP